MSDALDRPRVGIPDLFTMTPDQRRYNIGLIKWGHGSSPFEMRSKLKQDDFGIVQAARELRKTLMHVPTLEELEDAGLA